MQFVSRKLFAKYYIPHVAMLSMCKGSFSRTDKTSKASCIALAATKTPLQQADVFYMHAPLAKFCEDNFLFFIQHPSLARQSEYKKHYSAGKPTQVPTSRENFVVDHQLLVRREGA